jgi:hypothetical protein
MTMNTTTAPAEHPPPDAGHLEDIKFAANPMLGAKRRAFQAAMALKYCAGSARRAEALFGWSRPAVPWGRHEARTGVVCLSAQSAFAGDTRWEEKPPEVAAALWALAPAHAQQAPTCRTTLAFTRLTAREALEPLRAQGFAEEGLPAPSPLAAILNRNGYRRRPVVKAKPQSPTPMPSSPTSRTRTRGLGNTGPGA